MAKKYKARLTKIQWRNLYGDVQTAKPGNRSQDDWLSAANRETEPLAAVVVSIARAQFLPIPDPEVFVEKMLSFEATCGAKLALIQAAAGANFRKRETIRETARGFGDEFAKIVEKQTALEDSKDLDENAELAGVPATEDAAAAPAEAPKKE